jgi:hypothetical protein
LTPQQIADQELADSRKAEYKMRMADIDERLKLISENFSATDLEAANTLSQKLCNKVIYKYGNSFKKGYIFVTYSKREFHKLDVPRFIGSVDGADQMTESDRRNYIVKRKKEFYDLIILMVRVQLKATKPNHIDLFIEECHPMSENYITVKIQKFGKGPADKGSSLDLILRDGRRVKPSPAQGVGV